MPRAQASMHVSPEQRRYAQFLAWGARAGFVVLVAAFAAYLAGALPAYVPLAQLPALWHLPATAYRDATGVPLGWAWIAHVGHGEFASLAGIAILAGCSLASLVAVLVSFHRRGDRAYVAITLALIAVMAIAASGVLNRLH